MPVVAIAQSLPTTGDASADAHIVRLAQQGYHVESASVSYDGKTLWLSMRKSPREVHDIYSSTYNGVRWSQPAVEPSLTSDNNDYDPSISSDGQVIYFVREEQRQSGKKSVLATNLYTAVRQPDGSWQRPQQMPVSNGHDRHPVILKDNRTLCITSSGREEDPKQERRYYLSKIDKYNWTLPIALPADVSDEQSLCRPTIALSGKVSEASTGRATAAHLDVYDALTLRKLSEVGITNDGAYRLILTSGKKYRLDVWQNGYSHKYNIIDATDLRADSVITWDAQITKQLKINIAAYDADNMSKLSPTLEITDAESGLRLAGAGRKQANDTWQLTLSIGKDYVLHLTQAAYADTSFHIDTRRDVRFSETDIDIMLHAGKLPVQFILSDAETSEHISGDVTLLNITQDEKPIEAQVPETGSTFTLKCATRYSVQLSKERYLYKDTIITLPAQEQTAPYVVAIALEPLKKAAVVRLNNIEFEFNSYLLKEESFVELHHVAELLRQNPTLRIEISAHTDDVGSDAYNLRLSKKRGEAAAKYLIEQEGVLPQQLTTIGYGKNKPLVPNTSDENRAINRRVEFTIIEL